MQRRWMADRHDAKASAEVLDPDGALQAAGAALRSARLERGLSLPDVAARLFLRPEQLEALESADPHGLPETVYVIAQVQRVGSFLGLDTESLIAPLRAASFTDRPRSAPWTQPLLTGPPARTTTQRFRALRGKWNPAGQPSGAALKAAVLIAALASGALLLWRSGAGNPPERPPGVPQPSPPASSSSAPPGSAPPATARPADSGQLTLRSASPSWMEVRTGDGTALFRGTFAGEKSFPLGSGLEELAGRPDLVTAAVGSGPATPLGPIDQVRWYRFGRDGTRSATGPY